MTKHSGRLVAYYRVSTGKQGLCIDAQRKAVLDWVDGGRWTLVAEFTEFESGKAKDRPKLKQALAECRLRTATLVIAKLDRLARNVAFISNLMDNPEVEFVAVDNPNANRLTIHIMAAVAEHDASAISQRIKAALAALKATGKHLGTSKPHLITKYAAQGSAAGLQVCQEKARQRAMGLKPVVEAIRAKGITSRHGIARELNAQGHTAPRGGSWRDVQVMHLLKNL
jgi:DNA invertase Pin-like site-specific DNA recombinase